MTETNDSHSNCISKFMQLHHKEIVHDQMEHQGEPNHGRPFCLAVIIELLRPGAAGNPQMEADIHKVSQYLWENPEYDRDLYAEIFGVVREVPDWLPDNECEPWIPPQNEEELRAALIKLGIVSEGEALEFIDADEPSTGQYL